MMARGIWPSAAQWKDTAMSSAAPSPVNAISAQNLILPAGTAKIGMFEYAVETNSSPGTIDGLNDLPIRSRNGAVVFIKDVAHVRDGNAPQTNIVRVNGQRASLLTILKSGSASTLTIISEGASRPSCRSRR